MKKLIVMLAIFGLAGTYVATAQDHNTPMDHGQGKDKGEHRGEKKHHHHHEHHEDHHDDHKGGRK